MQETAPGKIHKLEVTDDTLTSRGGLAFFVKYVQAIGILGLLLHKFAGLKKSVKGVAVQNLFFQVLYFFFDGTSRHLTYFDELQREEGYRAVVEMAEKQMASSHALKRFFGAFHIFHAGAFRWVLKELFLWRLQQDRPRVVVLTLDTMVMDNDEALQREGCDPTYKKVKGFQPLQLIWEGKVVDAIFRRGKRHSNYGHDVEKMIRGIVTLLRTRYDASVSILIRLDAGFFDEKNFALCDELGLGFLATGKVFAAIKEKVAAIPKKKWEEYDNGRQVWSYARFSYKCEKWTKAYRALYTRPRYEDQQRLLEFARPDNIIVTNLVSGEPVLERMPRQVREYWEEDTSLIYHHHQRGADELPHRGLKEFGSEQLPFKRFAANQAYYYLMLVSFFLFETFKEDNLKDILPLHSYATTLRRKLIDFAAKVVRSGHEVILKVPQAVMDRLKLQILWTRCQNAVRIQT
jgi:Transposase DDE domain group 1